MSAVGAKRTLASGCFWPKADESDTKDGVLRGAFRSPNRPCRVQARLEKPMATVQVEQKSYEMPPREGFTVAHFLTVADIDRSLDFYEKVFGGTVLSRGDSKGAPGYLRIANTWLIVNPGVARLLTNRRSRSACSPTLTGSTAS